VSGPLGGLTVVELAGIGPGPFCAMLLADLGAEVVRVQRPGGHPDDWGANPVLDRGRRRIVEADLKSPDGVETVLDLAAGANALIEGFRPGVMERLGLGPAECLARNRRLVYGRMTGWGQDGPYAQTAGHDITYLAITGALHAIGRRDAPTVPLNIVGDFGGGGMLLAFGMLAAVWRATRTGRGQVVDAAIVDGVAALTGMVHGSLAQGAWADEREANLLDGGAPFYDTYACADGRHVAVGALEPKFFRALIERLGIAADPAFAGDHLDPARWPAIRERLTAAFASRPRDAWTEVFAGTDCCVAPVLTFAEAAQDPHNVARGTFRLVDGHVQPSPAPRFGDIEA
jgi:alpha-methylacyl-CoA racemase